MFGSTAAIVSSTRSANLLQFNSTRVHIGRYIQLILAIRSISDNQWPMEKKQISHPLYPIVEHSFRLSISLDQDC